MNDALFMQDAIDLARDNVARAPRRTSSSASAASSESTVS